MMQHIATAKSEIAAFSKGIDSDALASSASNDQFDKILQEQKSHNSPIENHLYIPSPSSVKNESRVTAEEVKNKPSKTLEDKVASGNDAIPTEKTSNESLEEQTEVNSVMSKNNTLAATDSKSSADEHYCPYGHADEGGATLELLSSDQGEGAIPEIESSSVIAQEWVELVGNLQKLTNEVGANEPDGDLGTESETDISQDIIGQSAEEYVADTISTFIQLATDEVQTDVQVVDELQGDAEAADELQVSLQTEYSNVVVSETQKEAEVVSIGNTETDQIILNIDADDIRVQQKTVEMLLDRPDVLQKLVVNIDTGVKESQLDQPLDITTDENKALLSSLLTTPELVKFEIEQAVVQVSSTILDSKIESGLVNQLQTEAILTEIEPEVVSEIEIVEQITEQLAEQDVAFIQPRSNNSVDSIRIDKTAKNADVKILLNLPENKLDKVLDSIAQIVLDKSSSEPTVSEQVQTIQQTGNTRATDIIYSNDSNASSKDLVGALKSGLDEFKSQLAQGREPGIDLKSLVTDALSKTVDETVLSTAKVSSEQLVNGISQVLNFANSLNQTIEQNQNQTYNATLRDVAQIQGEQTKQAQLTPFESKFEKAVNIAKPEGHQQLAEKVRWMVNTKNLVAEIRLDPAELGSMHVKVAVSGESATVNFVVQSQQARDAVDTATPRLKEMLAEKGIELGQSSVEQENRGQQQGESESGRGNNATNTSVEEAELAQQSVVQQKIVNGALGGIDYFV